MTNPKLLDESQAFRREVAKLSWRTVTENLIATLSLFSNVMSNKNYLTVDEFRKIWKNEFLPSIRREVKLEIETLSANIQALTDQCNQIEQSIQPNPGGGGTPLFGLYGDVPLDRVWFFGLAVLNRVCNLTCLCPKQFRTCPKQGIVFLFFS